MSCTWPGCFALLFGILVLGGNPSRGFHSVLGLLLLVSVPFWVARAVLRVICYG